MAGSERPGINFSKIESNERTRRYETALRETFNAYGITDESLRNPRTDVIKTALRLMDEYQLDPNFTSDPEKNLFALALADEWLATTKTRDKKGVLAVLKLVATGKKESGEFGTQSEKVRVWVERSSPRGTEFAPEGADLANYHDRLVERLYALCEAHQEQELTERAKATLADWSVDSPLQRVRENLRLTTETERHVEVVVLDLTEEKLLEQTGTLAFALRDKSQHKTVIGLGSDHTPETLAHEYAHSQVEGFTFGYRGLLFKTVEEATLGAVTENPNDYSIAQYILNDNVIADHPYLRPLFISALKGNVAARRELFTEIIKHYRLEGFLKLARLAPGEMHKQDHDPAARHVFLSESKVNAFFLKVNARRQET